MLDLTREERKVVLFLLAVALSGAGIKFALKSRVPAAAEFLNVGNAFVKLDLNKAGLAEMLRARALPSNLAKKVIDYRLEHGAFHALEDVKKIKGIGKYRYQKLEQYFFVD